MNKQRVVFYENELEDEFSTAKIKARAIDENYVYCRDKGIGKPICFLLYRLIATPIAYIYTKLSFGHSIVNAHLLRQYGNSAYFIYGNHTQDIADACIPSIVNFPKKAYVIAHANNVSMPFLGNITPYLGAIPLPDGLPAYENFSSAIDKRVEEGSAVVIYPEAHIWPYYTGIRPFSDASFHYPVKYGTPVFCFTNTYQKRKFGKKPKIVTYVDGPFFADESLPARKRRKDLRDRVYNCMCERSKLSDVEVIKYIKKDD